MTAVFEFKLPGVITQFASFMFSFMGRGICCITLDYGGLAIASGVIVAVIGIAYIVLQFLSFDAPSNMRKEAFDGAGSYSADTGVGGYSGDNTQTAPYSQPHNNPATVNAEVV